MNKALKANIIKGLKVLMILLFTILFITILITSKTKIGDVVCTDIKVNITQNKNQELSFINEADVLNFINNYGASIVVNKKIKDINKTEIEKRIELNEYVANAEVFTNYEGSIKVNVEQKSPIYRVFNNKGVSYYVGNNGEHIPISSKFTPRLIVATGYLPNNNINNEELNQQIKTLVNYIETNDFWNALIGQIYVEKNGDLILYPKIGEHKVILGNTDNLEEKFKYLKVFYKEALKYVNWTQYESINLKYKGQIICTKKE